MNYVYGLLFMAAGIFCFLGAYKRWGFFVRSGKYRSFARLLGENGARIFYMLLGIFIIIMSFVAMFGEKLGIFSK